MTHFTERMDGLEESENNIRSLSSSPSQPKTLRFLLLIPGCAFGAPLPRLRKFVNSLFGISFSCEWFYEHIKYFRREFSVLCGNLFSRYIKVPFHSLCKLLFKVFNGLFHILSLDSLSGEPG